MLSSGMLSAVPGWRASGACHYIVMFAELNMLGLLGTKVEWTNLIKDSSFSNDHASPLPVHLQTHLDKLKPFVTPEVSRSS